ncbi:carboxymuconolactone decarboxylase family protein [Massilia glaciei]|uniref:carboxymuconolactone decarboxylase family protein n=1 Tax=Massilia glaciei TaxID=1524097 RepID=UPI0026A2B83B|nr:carboxymuconolactone decarboxylase family protein [Massilia glaciei]
MANTANGYKELTASVSKQLGTLREDLPDVMKGFGELARAATRDGALSRKTKELIALTLGVAAHCDACIGFHVQALVRLGTTKAELEEALGGHRRCIRPTPWRHSKNFRRRSRRPWAAGRGGLDQRRGADLEAARGPALPIAAPLARRYSKTRLSR